MVRVARFLLILLTVCFGANAALAQGNGNCNGPPEHSNAGGNDRGDGGGGPPDHANAGGNGGGPGSGPGAPDHSSRDHGGPPQHAGSHGRGDDRDTRGERDRGNRGPGNGGGNAHGRSGHRGESGPSPRALIAPPAPSPSGPGATAVAPVGGGASERAALEAVQSGRAVPLQTILPDLQSRTGGQMIDARLVSVQGFLLYAIKVLTPEGRVEVKYYYAQSGLPVRGQ